MSEATTQRTTPSTSSTVALAAMMVLLALHVVLRAKGLFGPPQGRPLIMASFLMLWPTPWLLLRRDERRAIGFGAPRRRVEWLIAAGAGVASSAVCFGLCYALFQRSADNPFVSIGGTFLSGPTPPVGPFVLFLIFTGPALIFSPFGEEVFCRGVIFGRVRERWGDASGMLASALVFASIHLLHHGLTRVDGALGLRVVSGSVWFVLMFGLSLMFSRLRKTGGSIWLAVVAHATFNLVMNAGIFGVLV
jgi:hypothetical protein